jgi:tetratricopeptide (TPR) repeat protein
LNAVLYSNRAAAALSLQLFREAELDCSIAISLDKGFGKAYFRRAQARLKQNKLQAARFDAQDAVKIAPGKATSQLLDEIDKALEEEKREKDKQEAPVTDQKEVEEEIKEEKIVEEVKKEIEVVAPVPVAVVNTVPRVKYSGPLKCPTTAYELGKRRQTCFFFFFSCFMG